MLKLNGENTGFHGFNQSREVYSDILGRSKSIKMRKGLKLGDNKEQGNVLLFDLGKYEEIISNYLWIVMLFLIAADTFTGYVIESMSFRWSAFFVQLAVFVLVIAISVYKMLKIRKEQIKPGLEYTLLKVLDIVLVVTLLNTMIYDHYFYFVVFLPIVSICITKRFFDISSLFMHRLCHTGINVFLSKNQSRDNTEIRS